MSNSRNLPLSERMDELLLERALFGLSDAEEHELGEQRESNPARDYELAAASVALALAAERPQPLDDALRAKLEAGAKAYFAVAATAPSATPRAAPKLQLVPPAPAQRASAFSYAGWLAAAAAAALAVIAWWPESQPPAPTSAQARAELLARANVTKVEAKGQEQFAPGTSGDIVWSNNEQTGFIRLVGAPVNDPKVQQYQLWIFDEAQEHPVDGGVFDVNSAGEVLIPIDAKLRVTKPTLFAITLEKPGGVVVSDRQRIAIVAPIS